MYRFKTALALLFLLFFGLPAFAVEDLPQIEHRVDGLVHMQGFFDLYWDEKAGRLLLRVENTAEEFIYQSSLARGIGSNDLRLDRGQLGATRLVGFFLSGPKLLLVEQNLDYRAVSSNPQEQDAVELSFARSVIWGFEVIAQSGDAVLVDATDFFLRDAHDISTRLRNAQQGEYAIDATRSAIFLPRTKVFPDNTEVEALVTYVGERQFDGVGKPLSNILPSVVPDPTAITVHLHHSFIRLPDDDYNPLRFDPRSGMISSPRDGGILDYGSAVGEPLKLMYARRHRLQKQHPEAELSEAVEPIIYYVDTGVPEPIRSALIEGAGWWNQAFTAAGYKNAFQVRMLPEGADPMDVRYNVIQWVHRSTRGWSYGSSIVDPRSGEILKGHVTLGSLRVRQDYLIAEGLLAPYDGDTVPDDMLEMSLARIRQLSAHEVGHTIGLEHNFAASVNDRASVMDYPFPLIRFASDGGLDLSDAYAVGIGDWDQRTIEYAYQDFPDSVDDGEARQAILQATIDSGLLFVSDGDSRDPGTENPWGNLWDNGANSITELEHLLKVRAYALARLSENSIRPGRAMATIEEVLVPIYLLHRYQIEAVGKLIGGQYFTYAMRGDGQALPVTVDGGTQQAAIKALVAGLDPGLLVLPQALVDSIPPRPPGHSLGRESFARATGVMFDPIAPAASAVSLTLDVLLNSTRAARMEVLHAADSSLPEFSAVLDSLVDASWYAMRHNNMQGAIQRSTNDQVLRRLMALSALPAAPADVRAQAQASISGIDQWLAQQKPKRLDADWAAHYAQAQHEITRMFTDPAWVAPAADTLVPPGSPIGN